VVLGKNIRNVAWKSEKKGNMKMQITKHIHAIKIPFQIAIGPGKKVDRFVYTYLIYGKKICLIDTGVASSEQVIFDYIRKTGRNPDDISLIVLTHSHPDHIGAAP